MKYILNLQNYIKSHRERILFVSAILILFFGNYSKSALAQESQSSLYVPLIGISSVPDPLALPKGPGSITYHYAVKNFLSEYPLDDIKVTDDKCSPIKYIEGDDNGDGRLGHSETWRYTCTIKIYETTQSIATATATATGTGNTEDLPAAHKAYVTVVVGSDKAAPLVNIINVTKVAYPLALPSGGGDITFTYRVNNPGAVPLSNVIVIDDKCSTLTSRLGDTNGNNLLDIFEVWVYTCTTHLTQTTTNTVSVTAYANGLKAVGYATLTVTVNAPSLPNAGSFIPCFQPSLENSKLTVDKVPCFPNTGIFSNFRVVVWATLLGVLAGLMIFFFLARRNIINKNS